MKRNKFKTLKVTAGASKTLKVAPGKYLVKIIKMDEIYVYRRKTLRMHFEICDGESSGEIIPMFVNFNYQKYGPNTKLYQQYSTITNEQPDEGDEIDLGAFLNKVFQVEVVEVKSKKTGNSFANVSQILSVVEEL